MSVTLTGTGGPRLRPESADEPHCNQGKCQFFFVPGVFFWRWNRHRLPILYCTRGERFRPKSQEFLLKEAASARQQSLWPHPPLMYSPMGGHLMEKHGRGVIGTHGLFRLKAQPCLGIEIHE